MPEFTYETGIKTILIAIVFWFIMFIVLHYLIITPFMTIFRKRFGWIEPFHKLNEREKRYYTSYWHGSLHAVISTMLSLYCFIYADGVAGTTWFHCNFYKLNMFDVQKYCHMISIGYLIYDLIFCLIK